MRLHALATLASLSASVACDVPALPGATPAVTAEFGVFYGGQIQERDEIPLELDPARQRQGFRVTLSPPPASALEVRWELGKPGVGRRASDGRGRKARPRALDLGRAHFRPGEPVFEQPLPFEPGDPLGLWNIRVVLAERVVIDRPFLVFDPLARARRLRAAALSDAGI